MFSVLDFASRAVTSERPGAITPWLSAIETEVINIRLYYPEMPNLKQELLLFLCQECGEG